MPTDELCEDATCNHSRQSIHHVPHCASLLALEIGLREGWIFQWLRCSLFNGAPFYHHHRHPKYRVPIKADDCKHETSEKGL
jgi:hypothetical protein